MADFFVGGNGRGKLTQTAGTAIVIGCDGKPGYHCNLVKYANTAGATAHTLTVMRDASYTTLSAAAAASQAVVVVTAALTDGGGNAIASGDYVALQLDNGEWHYTTFSSASGLSYTLGANLPSAAAAGNRIYCYGVIGDAFHDNYDWALAASAQTVLPAGDEMSTLVRSRTLGAPLITYNGNATNASTADYVMWGHSRK